MSSFIILCLTETESVTEPVAQIQLGCLDMGFPKSTLVSTCSPSPNPGWIAGLQYDPVPNVYKGCWSSELAESFPSAPGMVTFYCYWGQLLVKGL